MADEAGGASWLYQARRVATNAAAAGNPILIDISLNPGQIAQLIRLEAFQDCAGAGTSTLLVEVYDEDFAINSQLATAGVASGTGYCFLPSIGSAATGSANYVNSVGMLFGPGEVICVRTGSVAANAGNELTVALILMLYNVATEPTWDHTRSIDTANITLAASTISAANTIQAVRLRR